MKFRLHTKFKPTGDQPDAISKLTQGVNSNQQHQTLLGVTGSGKTFTLANVIQEVQKPTLIISHNKTLAAQLYQEFRDFFPENAVSYFVSYYDYYQPESYIPSTDTYIEKETDINDEIDKLRLSATVNLLSRPDVIVVASVSCIYNLGSPLEYAKNFVEITPGQILPRQTLVKRLVDIQYTRHDYKLNRGTFRIMGDNLQLWPGNLDHAISISFIDQQIESINYIHPVSMEPISIDSDQLHQRFTIYPAKHYQTDQKTQQKVFSRIKKDLELRLKELRNQGKIIEAYRLSQKVKYDLEMINELGYVSGIENYSRYFDGRSPGDPPFTLLDYFSHNLNLFSNSSFLTIIDESHITLPQLRGMYRGDQSRKQTLIDYGFRLPSALDNRPLQFEEIIQRLPQTIYASATPKQWELEHSHYHVAEQLIRPTGLIEPSIDIRSSKNQIPNLVKEIIARVNLGQRALVTTLTKKTAEALTEYLSEQEKINQIAQTYNLKPKSYPKVQYLHADVDTLERSDILDNLRAGEYDVLVGINLLREGLDLPEVSLVAILEADREGFLRSKTSLIQIMGRTARHQDGQVIMYADTTTNSMHEAITEVNRRRDAQIAYNKTHNIKPQSINKPIRNKLLNRFDPNDVSYLGSKSFLSQYGWQSTKDIDTDSLTPKDKRSLVKTLTTQMNQAAKDWDFEKAAQYRDIITNIKSS